MSKLKGLGVAIAICCSASCIRSASAQKLDATVLYRQNSDSDYSALIPGYSNPASPDCAADLANAVAEAYRDNAVRKKSVEIIDRAIPAVQPCKPNKPLNIALGFVAGIVFGMLFATLAWALTSRRS